eukprot:CAMPEP_0177490054 /NCGR_PEP_ID=MMETSP0369-20130122/31054_1 /TAXON_ID=447022 ORGANISM="Scrippsiella hangoei-like, Strain SHHI-4" /NCGR_SAMPLE_ID=MMETSP0369 /ASSEMBLY_ACC=CAM_ASM_000364 /LENGTH=102 /DNA_ID=CAMNT_0018966603 /DNA_START=70 /DNA_END=375 /DNA_ORIENTATION=-
MPKDLALQATPTKLARRQASRAASEIVKLKQFGAHSEQKRSLFITRRAGTQRTKQARESTPSSPLKQRVQSELLMPKLAKQAQAVKANLSKATATANEKVEK